jgi:predicted dehydrogenase
MNQAIHSIDLLQWLMGPVRSIYGYADTLAHTMETEDTVVAVLRFASGALGTVIGTTAAFPGVTARVELFGDQGSATIENDRLGFLHLSRDGEGEAPAYGLTPRTESSRPDRLLDAGTTANPAALSMEGHAAQIADMVRAIQEDGTPLVDGQEGRRAVDIILAIYESARTGREVVVHE